MRFEPRARAGLRHTMLQSIEQALTNPELEQSWKTVLEGWSGSPAESDELLAWIAAERDAILEVVRAALDPSDLETSVMVRYIELRSQWIRYNALNNYTLMRTGMPPLETMFRGSLISSLIEALESFIDRDDLMRACDFLATPLGSSGSSL